MEEKNKKTVIAVVIVVVVLMVLSGAAGVGIGMKLGAGKTTEQETDAVNADVSDSIPTVSIDSSVAGVSDVSGVSGVSGVSNPSEVASVDANAITVGPYTTGVYYTSKTNGNKLRLRNQPANGDGTDTGVQIPANTKLVVTNIVEATAADGSVKYWGAVNYSNTDGYVDLVYLAPEAEYLAGGGTVEGESASAVGGYKTGTFKVETGGYGVRLRSEPGDGDVLAVLDDGEVVEVLSIEKWDSADAKEDDTYWGLIDSDYYGEAYVPMYYMEAVAD